jgi:hypothetical protein
MASVPPVPRPVRLPRAKPLEELEIGGSSGIDFDALFRRQDAGKKAGDSFATSVAGAAPARPNLSQKWLLGIALAALLGLAGLIAVIVATRR